MAQMVRVSGYGCHVADLSILGILGFPCSRKWHFCVTSTGNKLEIVTDHMILNIIVVN